MPFVYSGVADSVAVAATVARRAPYGARTSTHQRVIRELRVPQRLRASRAHADGRTVGDLAAEHAGRVQAVLDAGRRLVALQGIARDYLGKGELERRQEEDLERRLVEAQTQLPQRLAAAYRHIAVGGPDDTLKTWNLGAESYDPTRSLGQRVWDTLREQDQLLEQLDPMFLLGGRWPLWPEEKDALRVQELWDYFTRYTYLPLLANRDVLADTIARGVERGLFGYALGDGASLAFDTRRFKEPMRGQEVEFINSAWLVRPRVAETWPRESEAAGRLPFMYEQRADTTPALGIRDGPPADAVVTGDIAGAGGTTGTGGAGEAPAGVAASAHRHHVVRIDTPIRWEHWHELYNEIIDPLVREGATLDIRLHIDARSEAGIDANTIELRIKESLAQRGLAATVEVGEAGEGAG